MSETIFYLIIGILGGLLIYCFIYSVFLKKNLTEAILEKGKVEIEKARLEAMAESANLSSDERLARIRELLSELRRSGETH